MFCSFWTIFQLPKCQTVRCSFNVKKTTTVTISFPFGNRKYLNGSERYYEENGRIACFDYPSTAYRLQIKEIKILCQNRSEHNELTKSLCACVSIYIYIYVCVCVCIYAERDRQAENIQRNRQRDRDTTNASTFELLSGFFCQKWQTLTRFQRFFLSDTTIVPKKNVLSYAHFCTT